MKKDELTAIADALDSVLEMVARINFDLGRFDAKRTDDARASVSRLREFANEVPVASSNVPTAPTATAPKVDDEEDYIMRIARNIEALWREQGIIK